MKKAAYMKVRKKEKKKEGNRANVDFLSVNQKFDPGNDTLKL